MPTPTLLHCADLALMGLPARVEAHEPRLLEAVLEGYATWSAGGAEETGPALLLRLGAGHGSGDDDPPSIRLEGQCLRLEGSGVRGEADAERREAWCSVPPTLAADPDRLLAEVVDPLLLFLLTRAGRVPVHAAGVMIGGTAVVLAGRSGSGKSTLTLAALREGLEVLSDDTLFVALQPRLRVWGLPRPVHLLPETPLRAEEVGAVLRRRGGRWKLALTASHGWARGAVAERATLCVLRRGTGVELLPLDPEVAAAQMDAALEPGFDHFRDRLPAVVRALAAGGARRLVLSPRPEEAIAALREEFGGCTRSLGS
jgi:hypothetical protein